MLEYMSKKIPLYKEALDEIKETLPKHKKGEFLEEINELRERNRVLEKLLKGSQNEKDELKKAVHETLKKQDEINGLLKCARAVLRSTSFEKTARDIFDV